MDILSLNSSVNLIRKEFDEEGEIHMSSYQFPNSAKKGTNLPFGPYNACSFGSAGNIKGLMLELDRMDGVYSKSQKKFCSFIIQPTLQTPSQKKALLPPIRPDRRYTLVLDLDETLIHYSEDPTSEGEFFTRPYTELFLEELSKYYEIVIFTASIKEYADFILNEIDQNNWITHRLYREHLDVGKEENGYNKVV